MMQNGAVNCTPEEIQAHDNPHKAFMPYVHAMHEYALPFELPAALLV